MLVLFAGVSSFLGAQDKEKTKPAGAPPFVITARLMRADIKGSPKTLIYSGDVKATSPMNQTIITCGRLEAIMPGSVKDVSNMKAQDNVVFSLVQEPAKKDDVPYKVVGHAELMVYDLQDGKHTVRLLRDKDVLPRLVITNMATQEVVADLTGNVIRYTLETGKLEVEDVKTENKGGVQ